MGTLTLPLALADQRMKQTEKRNEEGGKERSWACQGETGGLFSPFLICYRKSLTDIESYMQEGEIAQSVPMLNTWEW